MYIFCTTCIESANSTLSPPWDKVLIRPRLCLNLKPVVRLLLYSVRHWLASDCGEINTYSKRPYCIVQSNLVILNFLISVKLFTTASLLLSNSRFMIWIGHWKMVYTISKRSSLSSCCYWIYYQQVQMHSRQYIYWLSGLLRMCTLALKKRWLSVQHRNCIHTCMLTYRISSYKTCGY